jgi:hypothetical protein
VVWITEDGRLDSAIYQADGAIIEAGAKVRELAETFDVVELVHDPWRAQQLALELEVEGMTVVAFPAARRQGWSRRVNGSYGAIIERPHSASQRSDAGRPRRQCRRPGRSPGLAHRGFASPRSS